MRGWGPLWIYSAYPFENMNGRIVQLVNGRRFAQWQMVDKFIIMSALPKLCNSDFFFTQFSVKSLNMLYQNVFTTEIFCVVIWLRFSRKGSNVGSRHVFHRGNGKWCEILRWKSWQVSPPWLMWKQSELMGNVSSAALYWFNVTSVRTLYSLTFRNWKWNQCPLVVPRWFKS